MGRAILLTGRPGVGKTTVVRKVLARWEAGAGGFYTEEIREQGRRTGFRLVTLDGASGILASVNISSPYRVGKYGVVLRDLEQVGVEALYRSVRRADVSLIVVDEIGKMELFSPAFREAVEMALDSPKLVLGTVMARSHSWVDAIKARPNVRMVEVTTLNRSTLPEQILRGLLRSWVTGH
jgi:nucleoside-triphosphatase